MPEGDGSAAKPAVAIQTAFVRFGGTFWSFASSPGMKTIPIGML